MSLMFNREYEAGIAPKNTGFDPNAELVKHAWFPKMNAVEAEAMLQGQSTYTYLVRPHDTRRGFAISFVHPEGHVSHDFFTVLDPKYGIWRNCSPAHVGQLEKVLRDMMNCGWDEGTPIS